MFAISSDGGTVTDLAAALEQRACALAPGPVLPTALASLLLARSGRENLLPALAQAQATGCVALAPGTLTGTRQADGTLRVTGPVLWAAGHLFAPAATAYGDAWFLLEAGQPGVTTGNLAPLDFSRELAVVRLDDAVVPPEIGGMINTSRQIGAAVGAALLPAVAVRASAAGSASPATAPRCSPPRWPRWRPPSWPGAPPDRPPPPG